MIICWWVCDDHDEDFQQVVIGLGHTADQYYYYYYTAVVKESTYVWKYHQVYNVCLLNFQSSQTIVGTQHNISTIGRAIKTSQGAASWVFSIWMGTSSTMPELEVANCWVMMQLEQSSSWAKSHVDLNLVAPAKQGSSCTHFRSSKCHSTLSEFASHHYRDQSQSSTILKGWSGCCRWHWRCCLIDFGRNGRHPNVWTLPSGLWCHVIPEARYKRNKTAHEYRMRTTAGTVVNLSWV